jgi:hypothetical protein
MRSLALVQVLGIVALLALAGCNTSARKAPTYPVRVTATSDDGAPLQGVKIAADGRDLGATDAKGVVEARLLGAEGQRVQLSFVCPDRYESKGAAPSLMLRSFASIDKSAPQHTTVQVQCAARERQTVIAVRAGQPNLPVLMRGEVVAKTGESGTAHVLLKERAGSAVQLTLDTSASPRLRPASPTRMFTVAAKDDFTVWDQPFELVAQKVKKKAAPPPPPPKHVPYRMD